MTFQLLSLLFAAAAATTGCGVSSSTDKVSSSREPTDVARAAVTAATVNFTGTELLGRPTDHSITIKAVATQAVEAYFEYGTTQFDYASSTSVATFSDGMIEALLTDLSPNTRYYYRMRYRPVGSTDDFVARDPHTFHTQRAATETFTFAVQSDSHQGYAAFHNATLYGVTLQNIANDQPDFLIDLGDAFSLDDNTETVASVQTKYLNQRAVFQVAGHSTPLFLVLGNHENEEGWNLDDFGTDISTSLPVLGANARKRYFANPVPDGFYTGNDDPLAQLDGDHLRGDYYAFEWGNSLFVAIDPFWYTTKKPYTGTMGGEKNDEVVGNRWDWTLGRKQYDWLKQTLENSHAINKFVFAHHMTGGSSDYIRAGALGAKYCEWGGYNIDGKTWAFDTQRPGWPMPVHQLMAQNHVTAFFHGHDHVFAKEVLDDVVYQECPHAANSGYGTGFATNATDYSGATLVANSGYIRVTVNPADVKVEYVHSKLPTETGNGDVAASYSIQSCAAKDTDSDGTNDCTDKCPTDPAKTAPGQCGCSSLDTDSDDDGTADCKDTCPIDPNKVAPGICGCSVADTDSDGDTTPDCHDTCPSDPTKIASGQCGCGVADTDSDGDGTANCMDACPNDAAKLAAGVCGCGIADTDTDGDGTADCVDACPSDPTKVAVGVCGCGFVEVDSNGDGLVDCGDICLTDPFKLTPGVCGCGVADTDTDSDGTADCIDSCPNDAAKVATGICGCGIADMDTDGDGTANCNDACPSDPAKVVVGQCGCGIADTDTDGDGTANCNDACPTDATKVALGICGCGIADTDTDGDGTANCNDACPSDPAKIAAGQCGCGVADTDSNKNGKADCVDTTCSAATLVSNVTTGNARLGTAVIWTATANCSSPKYQFRMKAPRSQVWTTLKSYSTTNTYTWSTAGRATGAYSFQVWTRNSTSKSQYESQATATLTLTK